ncbi:hypothetical protein SAMN06265348_102167 [Pedobacter westerhofensis]|jgi:hypothetical protein|uniref:Uncharacterized protein n=1 Tax=Pedobacter westerhofensis TaxID=425512 RepID=A0A521BBL4_9SPHI|nr:hypothetical protein SAMN06265348_102167 [Pedobacter westerhofensis]
MKISLSKIIWILAAVLLLILACLIYRAAKEEVSANNKNHLGYPF